MSIEIKSPTFPESVADGTIANWLKKEGESVAQDEVIAEIETDKASMEVESQIEGIITEFLVENGQDQIAVKTPIAIIETNSNTEKLKGKLFTNTIDDQPKKKITKYRVIDQEKKQDKISVREAIRDALAEEMRRDKNVLN